MKRIVYLFVALLMMATADAQTLTERQKGLAACACLMAQGDMNRLEPTVRMALNKQKDSWFQHLTYHKDVQEGAGNEWCEPVDDATYNALK